MIKPGEDWGDPVSGPADVEVHGDDRALAAAVAAQPGRRIRFVPGGGSDLARAVALDPHSPPATEVPMDMLVAGATTAVNMIVVGTPPDRLRRFSRRIFATVALDGHPVYEGLLTTIVVATGEFLRGRDVVPRGHPGDGRCELQLYAVSGGQRGALRRRLGTGTHVPHPAIVQRTGRAAVEIRLRRPAPVEVDGEPLAEPWHDLVRVELVPAAYRLLV